MANIFAFCARISSGGCRENKNIYIYLFINEREREREVVFNCLENEIKCFIYCFILNYVYSNYNPNPHPSPYRHLNLYNPIEIEKKKNCIFFILC